MVQALALGGCAGVLYDLFRVVRARVRLRLLGGVLDLLFWMAVTAALFLWSLEAWGGWIRLYGAAGLFAGGVIYFLVCSRWTLKLGYFAADVAGLLLRVLLLPLGAGGLLLKKSENL